MRLPFGTALLALLLPLVAAAPQRRLQQTSSEEAVLGYLRNGSRLSQQQADMLEGVWLDPGPGFDFGLLATVQGHVLDQALLNQTGPYDGAALFAAAAAQSRVTPKPLRIAILHVDPKTGEFLAYRVTGDVIAPGSPEDAAANFTSTVRKLASAQEHFDMEAVRYLGVAEPADLAAGTDAQVLRLRWVEDFDTAVYDALAFPDGHGGYVLLYDRLEGLEVWGKSAEGTWSVLDNHQVGSTEMQKTNMTLDAILPTIKRALPLHANVQQG